MNRLGRALLLGLLLLIVSLDVGCGAPPPSRLALNDRMAQANTRLAELGRKFAGTLESFKEKPGDASTIRRDYDAIQKAVAEAKKQFENFPLPARTSKNAPVLLAAYKEFLKTEETICNTNLKRAADLAPGGADTWPQVEAEFKAAYEAETSALDKVKKAQKDYADEHYYRLVQKR